MPAFLISQPPGQGNPENRIISAMRNLAVQFTGLLNLWFKSCRPGLVGLLFLAQNAAADPTEVQYLSGTDKDNTVSWNFTVSSGRNAGVASTIPVPSCWETKGFGTYQYGSGSSSNGETGTYSYTFPVDSDWAAQRVFLVFEGSFTDTSASINGQSVGPMHQGGYYEFRYDVTSLVVPGANNLLEVTVKKWSSSTNIQRAESLGNDYWVFGGLYRPVYLEAKPQAYLDYVAANPLANGAITVKAFLGGITNDCILNAFVTDTNNVQLGSPFSIPVPAAATNATLSAALPAPNPWSAEFPTLYTLTVQLLDTNSVLIHTVTNLIGFRTVTFTNNVSFFINGKKIVMRGVCRHEEWPTTGRTTSRALSAMDIGLMKDANFNAIRMSHYPPNKVFLEECDRLGMYVLDEFASYQHGGDQGGIGPMDLANGIRLIREMIRRDVNHPCIFAWDNGNEGGANPNLDGGAAGSTNYFGLYDIQNRRVIRPQQGGAVFNGVITDHYELYSSVTNYLRPGALNVFMPTEMLHGLYDGGGGICLPEFWEAFRTAPNSGGMFLWSWDDQGIVRDDQGGIIDVSGQSGPDGIVGPYREKEASYYSYKSVYSPVQIGLTNLALFSGTLAISNRFDFTDLNQCTFNWQLGWYADAADPAEYASTNALIGGILAGVDSGPFSPPSIPPQTSGSITLPSFPNSWSAFDVLRLTATDPFGRNIYTWTLPLRAPGQIRDRVLGVALSNASPVTASVNASEVIVSNGPRVFHFSLTTGVLNSVSVSNQPVSLGNGPRPVAGAAWTVNSLTNYFDGTNYFLVVNDMNTSANAYQWCLRPDGWTTLTYRYTLTGSQSWMGITFDYPSNKVTGMTWLGQGPFRVWKNRLTGQEVFVHAKGINNTWTGQRSGYGSWIGTQWTYPEFSGYHGQFYWAKLQTTEQPITVVTPTPNLFLRVLSPPATDVANVNPPLPPGMLSLLHGISAMGAKFDAANTIAPSGANNLATGLYTGEVSFFFGSLPPSTADRDNNGLSDQWELTYFHALGQNPFSDMDNDGLPLLVENAFDLSPTNSNASSPRLPHFIAGLNSPARMAYSVPLPEQNFFSYLPQISGDLIQWFGADLYPDYFLIQSTPTVNQIDYTVEPNLSLWPDDTNRLFLRLQIGRKN